MSMSNVVKEHALRRIPKGFNSYEEVLCPWKGALENLTMDKGLKNMCGWNYYTMKFIGIWPEERKWNRLSCYKVLIPVSAMLCFICAPQTINLFFIWGDFDEVVENLSLANMTISISLLKTIIFWSKGKPLKVLLTYMAKDWKEAANNKRDKEMMEEIGERSRLTSKRSTLMCESVVVAYLILRFVEMRSTGRLLLFRAYFPFDTVNTPRYELVIFGQLVGAAYAAITYTAVDTFVAMLVLHVCGQLSNLRRKLKDLRLYTGKEFRATLAKIVEKHQHASTFSDIIEDNFNAMLLAQMIGCTIQLCFQCFQALMPIEGANEFSVIQYFFFLLYVLYVMIHLYLYCYVGERLLMESQEIADAAYECEWYDLTTEEAKCLIVIMCRAKSPFRFTAGGFCSFTLELFSEILKSSMGYLSVLYAMKAE